jgi:tRNA pseudouridine38-40 synthase
MKNIKIIIEFDGTNYKGWQTQLSDATVQGEIEKRVMVLTKEKVRVVSSGRTDAGVHAKRMPVNFLMDRDVDITKFKKSLNAILPDDISVIEIEEVDKGFHARRSAKRKVYEYHILNRYERSPFLLRYAWHVRKSLDLESIREASKCLVGEHDFTGFASTGSDVKTNVRTIYAIDMEKIGSEVVITLSGNGFLKQMVRNIVGLLVQVGLHKFSVDFVKEVLDEKNIKKPYKTAPAQGLFLKDVIY